MAHFSRNKIELRFFSREIITIRSTKLFIYYESKSELSL